MIKLTKKLNKTALYITKAAITAVTEKDGTTVVYVVGDSIPFEVSESVEEVVLAVEGG